MTIDTGPGADPAQDTDGPRADLLAYALSLPGAWEDHPWGETVVKVGKKVFVFFGRPDGGGLSLSVKLPDRAAEALSLPFVTPTGYGLGRAGWVTARFAPGEGVLTGWLKDWILESYRAVAPARLVKQLG